MNHERDVLVKLLSKDSVRKAAILKSVEVSKKRVKKGFKYQGTHWTQQLKNKARLRKMVKQMHAARHGGK